MKEVAYEPGPGVPLKLGSLELLCLFWRDLVGDRDGFVETWPGVWL